MNSHQAKSRLRVKPKFILKSRVRVINGSTKDSVHQTVPHCVPSGKAGQGSGSRTPLIVSHGLILLLPSKNTEKLPPTADKVMFYKPPLFFYSLLFRDHEIEQSHFKTKFGLFLFRGERQSGPKIKHSRPHLFIVFV